MDLIPLFARLREEQALVYRLVLASEGIPFRIRSGNGVWVIETSVGFRRAAVRAISDYFRENESSQETALLPAQRLKWSWSAVYPVVAIVLFHWLLAPGFERDLFLRTYAADARAIVQGQVYRCVTALLFHADWGHVAGNTAGLLLFGSIVAGRCGGPSGWLLIVTAGAIGNLVTALWYGQNHISIGASTAVFGALGIGVALRTGLQAGSVTRANRYWLPLAAGLALLGLLGTAAQSDLLAHFFGFISGLALGWFYFRRMPANLGWQAQAVALMLLLAILTGSWAWGLSTLQDP